MSSSSTCRGEICAYWSGYQLSRLSSNPYDRNAMIRVQRSIDYSPDGPTLVYNPPWAFIILAPILHWPAHVAQHLLLAVNIICVLGLGIVCWRLITDEVPNWFVILPALAFCSPLIGTFITAQLGIILALSVLGSIYLYRQDRPMLSAFCLIPWSIKPHLGFLLVFYLMLLSLRSKQLKFAFSLFLFTSIVVGASFLVYPSLFDYYFNRLPLPFEYRPPTISTLLRHVAVILDIHPNQWLLAVPATVALAGVALWFIRQARVKPDANILIHLAFLSCVAAPYGWLSDFSTLALIYVDLFRLGFGTGQNRLKYEAAFLVFLIWIAYILSTHLFQSAEWSMWYPFAVYVAWLRISSINRISMGAR